MSKGKLRLIKRRIDSTVSTKKITKAMQMVASARLNKAQKNLKSIKEYAYYAEKLISKITPDQENILVKGGKGTVIVVISTDMGLAGAFPTEIGSTALKLSQQYNDFVGFIAVGNRAELELKKTGKILFSRTNLYDIPSKENAEYILDDILDLLENNKAYNFEIVYGELKNALIQRPKTEKLLPIQIDSKENARYEYEPDNAELFDEASYLFLLSKIYSFMYETKLSELHARQNAMKNATENAQNLIEDLKLDYNKLRQASITTELIEIVNGAQALQQE
jgi:F-type H+-transporting ATPase subunit gamma